MTYSTNNTRFVYSFTKKLSVNEEQYKVNLQLLEESISLLSKYFDYRIVTDQATLDDVKNLASNINTVDTGDFIFIEDFKTSLISKLGENEILVDPDILMKKKPKLHLNADIIFDHKDSPDSSWYTENLEDLKGTMLYSRIIQAGRIPFVPNIGFFKIPNLKLRSTFLNYYRVYREDILNKGKDNPNQFNLNLGQYLLGIVLYEGNYSYFNLRSINTGKVYVHLAGPQKYKRLNAIKTII